jgi:hypothetical protein
MPVCLESAICPTKHCASVFIPNFLDRETMCQYVHPQCSVQIHSVPVWSHVIFWTDKQCDNMFTFSEISKFAVWQCVQTLCSVQSHRVPVCSHCYVQGHSVLVCLITVFSPMSQCASVLNFNALSKVKVCLCVHTQCSYQNHTVPVCSHWVFCQMLQCVCVFTLSVLSKSQCASAFKLSVLSKPQCSSVFKLSVWSKVTLRLSDHTHCSANVRVCRCVHS